MVIFPLAIILGIVAFVWLQTVRSSSARPLPRTSFPAIDRREQRRIANATIFWRLKFLSASGNAMSPSFLPCAIAANASTSKMLA